MNSTFHKFSDDAYCNGKETGIRQSDMSRQSIGRDLSHPMRENFTLCTGGMDLETPRHLGDVNI